MARPFSATLLGKLVEHDVNFAELVGSLNFVSDKSFKLRIHAGALQVVPELRLDQVDAKELETILDRLKLEHGLSQAPCCAPKLHLLTTKLTIHAHRDIALGVLSEYLSEHYKDQPIRSRVAFRALCDEIRLRTNDESEPITPDSLMIRKSFTRIDVQSIIEQIQPSDDLMDSIRGAIQILTLQGQNYGEIDALRQLLPGFEAERIDISNRFIAECRKLILDYVSGVRSANAVPATLWGFVCQIEQLCINPQLNTLKREKTLAYLRLLILEAILGEQQLQAADS